MPEQEVQDVDKVGLLVVLSVVVAVTLLIAFVPVVREAAVVVAWRLESWLNTMLTFVSGLF